LVAYPTVISWLADLVFLVNRQTNPDEVKEIFREESQTDRYYGLV
jgi:hypothetical protein